ncbi:hypothetical protein Ae168Ps1_0651 [Pseudonocardia sp. Ae168_Ps1]|nr:hypothetical protein Ae150APs1_0652 [Pseudonocardia sp. Ae150A_Ps1]OLL78245.1 hypothetical protein Ae168Ps1_0651 [Pseudonocardia sp. Ae168_Ps1]OLL87632.1 hypothetical protein Ae263Ps1_4687c [Pseudonocardia sp. Ae263_Ps1]OLL92341.1 hypothetical protein Ae356Ps1_2238 [Pseudonocardia sp. Ae356_Ps1]
MPIMTPPDLVVGPAVWPNLTGRPVPGLRVDSRIQADGGVGVGVDRSVRAVALSAALIVALQ